MKWSKNSLIRTETRLARLFILYPNSFAPRSLSFTKTNTLTLIYVISQSFLQSWHPGKSMRATAYDSTTNTTLWLMNRDVGMISTKGQLRSSSEHFPVSSMCMPWQVKKSIGPADHIPEMFMPRKAFDNELQHERLICREAKVIRYCLPSPRLMSQEPRCQMHRGITFHWLHRAKAPIDRC